MGLKVKSTGKAKGTPVDWPALKDEILSKLNITEEYESLGLRFSKAGADTKGRRECHAISRPDKHPSAFVNINTGVYHDSGDGGESLGFFDFALKHGERFGRWVDVIQHYAAKAGVAFGSVATGKGGRVKEATYLYHDTTGAIAYAVFRYRLPTGRKTFSQCPPDGQGGWKTGAGCMEGVEAVPYRLPEILESSPSEPIWIFEGEKDCDRARECGLLTTTNHGGSSNTENTWPQFAHHFTGRVCYVVPDNDPGGQAHAQRVATSIRDVAQSVKIVDLPDLPAKGDFSDWIDAGNTVDELRQIAETSPAWAHDSSLRNGSSTHHDDEPAVSVLATSDEAWEEPILDRVVAALPFPVRVLPPALCDLVSETAACLGCPPDYPGLSILGVASGAIGRSVAVALKEGWVESPALYAAIVGDPGMTKTPALTLISRPLWSITDDLLKEHKEAVRRAKETEEKFSDPPPLQRIVVEDTTVEALALTLQDNPRGLIMVRDELTAWVAGLNQYKKGGRGADRQFFLSAWSGSPVSVDRKGNADRIPVIVPRPFLSVLGALTPGMLTELIETKNRDDGFLDRLLFALPDAAKVRWEPRGVPEELTLEWDATVRRLWRRHMIEEESRCRPYIVRLTPDATALWGQWFDLHCEEAEGSDFPSHLKGAWSKLRSYCGRLALVLSLLRQSDGWEATQPQHIGETQILSAIALVDYFKCHAKRVRSLLRGAGDDSDDGRAILAWVKRTARPTFSERDARRNFSGRFVGDHKALGTALEWLQARRCVRPLEKKRGPGQAGRSSSPGYEVNPSIFIHGGLTEKDPP